jgi:hypothetical protein
MNKKTNAAMLLGVMSALAAGSGMDLDAPFKPKTPKPNNKMPLTVDEETALACLSGKQKKQYVKMLKEKYKK